MANQPCLLKEVSPLDLTRMVDEGSTFLVNIQININTDTSKEKKRWKPWDRKIDKELEMGIWTLSNGCV